MKLKTLLIAILFLSSCAHPPLTTTETGTLSGFDYRNPAAGNTNQSLGIKDLPLINSATENSYNLAEADVSKYRIPPNLKSALNKYFGFLGIDAKSKEGKMILKRLMTSSTQFLVCDNLEDWDCIESDGVLEMTENYRKDSKPGLGKKISAGPAFKMSHYFTKQYNVPTESRKPAEYLVQKLAKTVNENTWDTISMALYGVDDIGNSMKPFYESLVNAKKNKTAISAVFDAEGTEKVNAESIYFSHRGNVNQQPNFFTVITEDANGKKFKTPRTIGAFQYDDTPSVIQLLNEDARSEEDTMARVELPLNSKIMHNKFLVLSNRAQNKHVVWTGTANISQTCMGEEDNSNMAVVIEDKNIAEAFQSEFNEMFEFSGTATAGKLKSLTNGDIPKGKFHQDKVPNTQRFFAYDDGTEVRVHFAPTDDGEHRVIIPALLSVRAGDEVRISMFGSAGGPGGGAQGIEIVRAIQYAIEKGAHVRIVFDKLTNAGKTSWIYNKFGNIQNNAVYSTKPRGSFDYRVSAWGGLDHQKVATITRNQGDGKKLAETIIIGSQNWSTAGNDENDENMVTVRNRSAGVKAAEDFNDEFDNHLWKAGQVLVPKNNQAIDDEAAAAMTVDALKAKALPQRPN